MLLGLPSGQGRIGSYIDFFTKRRDSNSIPDDTELPETVTAVQVEFSEQKVFENDSIEQNFPRLFLYANTFETILRILNPSKVVCLTSSKTYQKELLLGFAKDLNTKIECW